MLKFITHPAVIASSVGLAFHSTNPTSVSFEKHFRKYTYNNIFKINADDEFVTNIIISSAAELFIYNCNKKIDDYFLFKIANVDSHSNVKNLKFIGIANNWYALHRPIEL